MMETHSTMMMEKIQCRYRPSNTLHLHHRSKASSVPEKDYPVKIDVDFYSHNRWLQRKITQKEKAQSDRSKGDVKAMARLDGDDAHLVPAVFATEKELKQNRRHFFGSRRLKRPKSAGEVYGKTHRANTPRPVQNEVVKRISDAKANQAASVGKSNRDGKERVDVNLDGQARTNYRRVTRSASFVDRPRPNSVINEVIEENDEEEGAELAESVGDCTVPRGDRKGVSRDALKTNGSVFQHDQLCTSYAKTIPEKARPPNSNKSIETSMQLFLTKGTRCFESPTSGGHERENKENRRLAILAMLKRKLANRSSFSCHEKALTHASFFNKGNKIRPLTAFGRLQNLSETFYNIHVRSSFSEKCTETRDSKETTDGDTPKSGNPSERSITPASIDSWSDDLKTTDSQQQKVEKSPAVVKKSERLRPARSGIAHPKKVSSVDPKPLVNFLTLVKKHPVEFLEMKQVQQQSDIDLRLITTARVFSNFTAKENIIQSAANEVFSRFLEQAQPVYDKSSELFNAKKADSYQKHLSSESSLTVNEQSNKDGLSELQQSRRQLDKWLSTLSTTHILQARDLALAELGENINDSTSWWKVNKSCRYLRLPCSDRQS